MIHFSCRSRRLATVLLAAAFAAACSFLLVLPAKIENSVRFGGDEWNYQALGVNLALGHGYVEGAAEPFATYKFRKVNKNELYYPEAGGTTTVYDWFMQGPQYVFKRTPGYPAFIAAVYKIAGISPRILKLAHVALVALTAAALVVIGYLSWGNIGALAGVFASALFSWRYTSSPNLIMTEPLISAVLAADALSILYLEMRSSSCFRTLLLGVLTGISLLVKGSMIFIPPIAAVCILFWQPNRRGVILLFVYIFTVALVLAPWALYATKKQGSLLLLSEHHNSLLIDGNNEDSLQDGHWHSEWRKSERGNPRFMVSREPYRSMNRFKVVGIFWWQHLSELPRFFLLKFAAVFGRFKFGAPVALLLLYYLLRIRMGDSRRPLPLFPAIFFANATGILLLFGGYARYSLPFMPFFLLVAVYAILIALRSLYCRMKEELTKA